MNTDTASTKPEYPVLDRNPPSPESSETSALFSASVSLPSPASPSPSATSPGCKLISFVAMLKFRNLIRCFSSSAKTSVAILWDLQTRPPKSVSPFEAASRLKLAASFFGIVRHMIAYAPRGACDLVPHVEGKMRKERNRVVIREEANICRVCGRRFYTKEKLVNHFRVHESEHMKRLSQIESASRTRRVNLVGKYAMKMDKYMNAVRDVMIPKQGNSLASELKRAGFWVRTLPVLSDGIVQMMDEKRFECLLLVSDESELVDVVMEARRRLVKTVVVGDLGDGSLKRAAGSAFLWREILKGKAEKQAVSVMHKWKDRNILKRLEWRYNPDEENIIKSDNEQLESLVDLPNDDSRKWWELDSDADSVLK